MLLAAGDVGSPVSRRGGVCPRPTSRCASHATRLPTTRPPLPDHSLDSVARTYTENGVQYTPVETKVSTGSMQCLCRRHVSQTQPRRLIVRPARSTDELRGVRADDGRVHGRSGAAGSYRLSASLEPSCIQLLPCSWESQQRVDHIDPRSGTIHGGGGATLPTQHSFFTGSHMVAVDRGDVGLPGTLVSVAEGGVLDSVEWDSQGTARFGYPNRRCSAHGHDVQSVRQGVRSSATSLSIDGSQGGHAPACEWVGRGAIWVTDKVATWR
jgi:hypothetical protein